MTMPTQVLPAFGFEWPKMGFDAYLQTQRGSFAGHSAISGWLSCPERARLRAAGIIRRMASYSQDELTAMAFGTLCHVLSAVRTAYGEQAPYMLMDQWASSINEEQLMKAKLIFRTMDGNYPLALDPFDRLGVEVEVISDVQTRSGAVCLRSVRYDEVVRMKSDGAIFSLEKKTMSRSGQSGINPYLPQGMCQQALWNANEALVQRYGKMRGVIFECMIKTTTPNVDRVGPRYFSQWQQSLALEYLRLPEDGGVQFSKNADGTYPRMLHACWGRYQPCEYINLCHENAHGDYEDAHGNTYQEPTV